MRRATGCCGEITRQQGRIRTTCAALLTTVLALLAWGSAQQQQPAASLPLTGGAEEPYISVVGTGVVQGQPDVATLQLGVTAQDDDVRQAVASVEEAVSSVRAALMRLDVAEEDVRTVAYDIWQEENYTPEGVRRAAGFRVQHTLAVEVAAERAGEVLAATVEAGVNQVSGVVFGFSDPAGLASRARTLAVEDARERALELAEAAGVTLGRPLAIEEFTGIPFGVGGAAGERSMASLQASLVPGEASIEVRVSVRFAIDR